MTPELSTLSGSVLEYFAVPLEMDRPLPLRVISMKYMVQLDGLRAIAILLVLIQHFSPTDSFFGSAGVIPVGLLGVDIFFVLSGFLITRILLTQSRQDDPLGRTVGRFLFRRAVRLFPIYYLVLCVGLYFDFDHVRENAAWLFTYTSNFLFMHGPLPNWSYGQFWSLAVEEQFYFVWPWIVLTCPRKHLGKVFAAIFVSGPISRLVVVLMGGDAIAMRFSTFCLFDLFGAGALLAWFHETGMTAAREELLRKSTWAALVLVVLMIGLRILQLPFWSSIEVVLVPVSSVGALLWARAVHACALRSSSWAGKMLEWPILVYVGKISYGIYVYHSFVKHLMPRAFAAAGVAWPSSFALYFPLLLLGSVSVSTVSWYLIEKPLNNLKNRGEAPAGVAVPDQLSGRHSA